MLILVGVTINVALNGGLFTKAEEATRLTQIETEKEELLSAVVAAIGNDGKVNFSYLDNNLPAEWKGTNGTYTSPKGNTYEVDEYGKITYIREDLGGGNTPVAFRWEDVGLTVDTNIEYVSEESGLRILFLPEGKLKVIWAGIVEIDATNQDNIDKTTRELKEFAVNVGEINAKGKIEMNKENKTDIDIMLTVTSEETSQTVTWVCKKILVDNEKVYSNEEVIQRLEITNYTGSYAGTWTKIGNENGKTKLVSTNPVAYYTFGFGDSRAIKAIPATNESAPTESEKYQRSIWSYKNAVNTLNTIAQEATGIANARSITLEDLDQLITVDRSSDISRTYNYSNHKGQTFVNEKGETITIDSAEDEITLKNSYTYTDLSEEEIEKVGPLAYYSCALASPYIYTTRDYANFGLFNWSSGIVDLSIFSSNGMSYDENDGIAAVIYIP